MVYISVKHECHVQSHMILYMFDHLKCILPAKIESVCQAAKLGLVRISMHKSRNLSPFVKLISTQDVQSTL